MVAGNVSSHIHDCITLNHIPRPHEIILINSIWGTVQDSIQPGFLLGTPNLQHWSTLYWCDFVIKHFSECCLKINILPFYLATVQLQNNEIKKIFFITTVQIASYIFIISHMANSTHLFCLLHFNVGYHMPIYLFNLY